MFRWCLQARNLYQVTAVDDDLQGSLYYDVIGDGVAPYYFNVNGANGQITLRNTLLTDKTNFRYDVSINFWNILQF